MISIRKLLDSIIYKNGAILNVKKNLFSLFFDAPYVQTSGTHIKLAEFKFAKTAKTKSITSKIAAYSNPLFTLGFLRISSGKIWPWYNKILTKTTINY